jgi:hypothetical protein
MFFSLACFKLRAACMNAARVGYRSQSVITRAMV